METAPRWSVYDGVHDSSCGGARLAFADSGKAVAPEIDGVLASREVSCALGHEVGAGRFDTPEAVCRLLGSPLGRLGGAQCRYTSNRSGIRLMPAGKIRIRMEAYDHQALDASAKEIVDHAKRTNARVSGPVPLPTRVERYTVLRSPFVDKKSREQFEIRTHRRIIDIGEPSARTVEALNRLVVPAGVFVKIKA